MLIATFSLPPEGVALEHTVEAIPEIEIEAERVAAHSTKWVMPCLWISNTDFDAVDDVFREDSSIETVVHSKLFDEEAFYHVDWADDVIERLNAYIDKEGSLLNAQLKEEYWQVTIRFISREQFDEFREQLTDESCTFQLLNLSEPDTPHMGYEKLTPAQRSTLVTAAEQGYFRVPRETTTDELAKELDISHQAISELLRRGTENLVFSTLTVEDGEGRP